MLSMGVVFTQILVILLYIAIGYVAGKCRLINPDQRKYLTTICTSLILPFTILSAAGQSLDRRQMAELGLSFVMMLGLFIATTFIAMRIQRRAPVTGGVARTAASRNSDAMKIRTVNLRTVCTDTRDARNMSTTPIAAKNS